MNQNINSSFVERIINDFKNQYSEFFGVVDYTPDENIILDNGVITDIFRTVDKFQLWNSLSYKNVRNALDTFGSFGTPIGIIDTSLFNRCKAGLLFTTKGIILKSHMSVTQTISYSELVLSNVKFASIQQYESSISRSNTNNHTIFTAGEKIAVNITIIQNAIFKKYRDWVLCKARSVMENILEMIPKEQGVYLIPDSKLSEAKTEYEFYDGTLSATDDVYLTGIVKSIYVILHTLSVDFDEAKNMADSVLLTWYINNFEEYTDIYTEELIHMTSNLNQNVDDSQLSMLDFQISIQEYSSDKFELLGAYVGARCNNDSAYNKYLNNIRNKLLKEEVLELEFFAVKCKNIKMLNIFCDISDGKLPETDGYQSRDGIGLTALHYAIIQRNETVIKALVESCKYTSNLGMYNKSGDYSFYEDFTIFAACAKLSESILGKICRETDPDIIELRSKEMWPLLDEYKKKKASMERWETGGDVFSSLYHMASQNADADYSSDYERTSGFVKDKVKAIEDEMLQIEMQISKVDAKIKEQVAEKIAIASNIADKIRKDHHPLIVFLITLIDNPQKLRDILEHSASEDCVLYIYEKLSFVTPSDVKLDIDYYDSDLKFHNKFTYQSDEHEDFNKKQSVFEDKKSHDGKWFSPEAYRDEKKLKEEYLRLAKKYHPDTNNNPESTKIFQEISNERDKILEQMNL